MPAIVDTEGPGGGEARVLISTAILIYLAEKTGKFLGSAADRPSCSLGSFFIASGLGPFSGQAVHFQFAAPEGLDSAAEPLSGEAGRRSQVLDGHVEGRELIVGDTYTIADISTWGWLDRTSRVRKGGADPLAPLPDLERLLQTIDSRPPAVAAHA